MDPLTQRLLTGAGGKAPAVLESNYAGAATVNFSTTPAANTLILFFGESTADVALPTGYTLIAQRTGANTRFLCAYKKAVGTETSVTSTGASVVGYIFLSVGANLDVTGTVATSAVNTITANGITPTTPAVAFLFWAVNNNCTTATLNDTGWTSIINTPINASLTREIAVWAKDRYDGQTTPNITVTSDNNPAAAVQFSVK